MLHGLWAHGWKGVDGDSGVEVAKWRRDGMVVVFVKRGVGEDVDVR